MAAIAYEGVGKRFGGTEALASLDLPIADGEFMVLVGPSGCGKSTALRIAAGLEDLTAGTVRIGGVSMNGRPPRHRNVAMVFQSYALYPHLSVRDNIGFGLVVRGGKAREVAARVAEVASLLELGPLLDRKPSQLSGGQRQRVAMGRAIARTPAAYLMDEPLSNLDAKLRVQMRAEIVRLQRLTGVTTIYVTHDQVEAMTMGHRVAVMNGGRLQQVAAPRTLYDEPANAFVAGFVGTPPMNLLPGEPHPEGGTRLRIGPGTVALPDRFAGRLGGEAVLCGVRPEAVTLSAPEAGDLAGTVVLVEDTGASKLVHLSLDGRDGPGLDARALVDPRSPVAVGDRAGLRLDPTRMRLFRAGGDGAAIA